MDGEGKHIGEGKRKKQEDRMREGRKQYRGQKLEGKRAKEKRNK